ncbi:MAG: hypothetical protein ABW007_20880 [Chitinophagaceae bacterium]
MTDIGFAAGVSSRAFSGFGSVFPVFGFVGLFLDVGLQGFSGSGRFGFFGSGFTGFSTAVLDSLVFYRLWISLVFGFGFFWLFRIWIDGFWIIGFDRFS